MRIIKVFTFTIMLLIVSGLLNQSDNNLSAEELGPPFNCCTNAWADSVYNSLTDDERLGQLFMIAAYSNKDEKHVEQIKKLIKTHHLGGLIFFQGGPVRQAVLTNQYQELSKVPLMISMDAEWGLGMRLDSTVSYPRQMTLGAIQDNDYIYRMGKIVASQCKRMGVHVNLAPVVDINNNPNNPVINSRSFGEERQMVTDKGIAYMKGLQDQNIIAVAKHFPGHGDTDTDSHKALPTINHDRARLDSIEIYPFKELMKNGLAGVMVAHLFIPALDDRKNVASTLSEPIITGLLKDTLGFEGLIFTDALNMKGVTNFLRPGLVDVEALKAGNDILLFSEDVPTAFKEIKRAIRKGTITQEEINERCKRILYAKQWVGLNKYEPIKVKGIVADLNRPQDIMMKRDLVQESITLLKNNDNILPLHRLDTLKIAALSIGSKEITEFQKTLGKYAEIQNFNIPRIFDEEAANKMMEELKHFNLIIVGVHNTNNYPSRKFGITPQTIELLGRIGRGHEMIVDVFANAYSMKSFRKLPERTSLILSYEEDSENQDLSAQLIFGGIGAHGKMPVSIEGGFQFGEGITTETTRMKYTLPEDVGIWSDKLAMIDSIALRAIRKKATPGCQILVAKDGKIFYQKSFGYHTYDKKIPVKNTDIYDLASITKIAASTMSLMKLEGENKVDIDLSLCDYIPMVDTTEYQNMVIREMLAHQAGLLPCIFFYTKTMKKGQLQYGMYSPYQSPEFNIRVADKLFLSSTYRDTIYKRILSTKIRKKEYKYSDLGYYLLQKVIETQTGKSLDNYVTDNFYKRMGLQTMGYKPTERFGLDRIVPTEKDKDFRMRLVHGYVHDPGAAMLGGVAGHAGLFSNSNDLAVLMQMLLDKGVYGGQQYLKEEVIAEFTKCQFCGDKNRKGAGFDRPARLPGQASPVCSCVSQKSFGHTGFTGTMTWVDPEEGLVYVFLSNRIHPSALNKKLISLNVRTNIQKVIYDAINSGKLADQIVRK
ncbi:MAG: serine hydrolase [Flavobacteriales bacterium]|nr:serine hydrolase [Flavobacteriales bacterium]